MLIQIPKELKDVKWDIRRAQSIYSGIYTHRLVHWITEGRIKKGEVMVWRGGLSGYVKPESLFELIPYFEQWEAAQKPKRKKRFIHKKREIKSILVIDDEEDICRLLKNFLDKKYEVNTVTTGRGGINFVKNNKPDMVLLDLKLKDMEGLSVLSRIKQSRPRTIVTMISAYGDEDVKKNAKSFGAFGFVDKPLYQKKIVNAIKRANA